MKPLYFSFDKTRIDTSLFISQQPALWYIFQVQLCLYQILETRQNPSWIMKLRLRLYFAVDINLVGELKVKLYWFSKEKNT